MSKGEPKYRRHTVKAVRGAEDRTIAKWTERGYELESRTAGKLRSELVFRQEVKPTPKALLYGGGAFVAIVIVAGIIAGLLEDSDNNEPVAGEPRQSASAEPGTEPSDEPTPTETSSAEPTEDLSATLTPRNNTDLAALLRTDDSCDPDVGTFAEEYADRFIEFDGSVADVAPSGDGGSNILVYPGNRGSLSVRGPAFQFQNVTALDMNYFDGDIAVDDRLRFTAIVGEYNAGQCLQLLEPVNTAAR